MKVLAFLVVALFLVVFYVLKYSILRDYRLNFPKLLRNLFKKLENRLKK